MPSLSGLFVAVAGISFLTVSFVQTNLQSSLQSILPLNEQTRLASDPSSRQPLSNETALAISDIGKANRLSGPKPAQDRIQVTTVELAGTDNAAVILRDAKGRLVYKSDPQSNVTYLAKDTDLPIVTMRENAPTPISHETSSQNTSQAKHQDKPHDGGIEQPSQANTKAHLIGCARSVSPLAGNVSKEAPSLCLASL